MKNASRILLIIGRIFHIIGAVSYFLLAAYMFIASIAMLATGSIPYLAGYLEELSEDAEIAISVITLVYGILFIFLGFLFIGYGVWSIIASNLVAKALTEEKNRKLAIVNIVFGAILDVKVAVVGSIFQLFVMGKVENEPKDGDVLD